MALLSATALASSLLSATTGHAPAAAGPAGAAPDPSLTAGLLPADAQPVAVTLVTGDTVFWQDSGDGNPRVAEIEQAPRDYPVTFDQSGTGEDFYVIPTDVIEHVADGTVDEELFNIPRLIRQGLDDAATDQLPVIVTFDRDRSTAQLTRDADALPATGDATAVESMNGTRVTVDRGQADTFRQGVFGKPRRDGSTRTAGARGLDGAVEQILLDRVLQIDLAESVPQIGAPQAWDAGYTGEGVTVAVLDTGIDASHPDLAGQVVAAANFTDEPDATDTHGHGTHVASTIAGTGAASDGARTGVAPGADLLNGKVCNTEGRCPTSAIMAGMEWATQQGADIINMSLGSDSPSDGTDPLSHLVNQLSRETGALFVTSAGNIGSGLRRIGAPAAADAALAVGAVDKSDQMASFSSRGPRVGDHAVKPEITAPGVDVVAARAEGTSAGNPVDDNYTSLDGTSMASPHAAGAAALLAQATGLAGGDLKDVLVSTAADGGFFWYTQGTGRVDVPAALDSPVYAQGTVNLGGIDGQAQRDLIYTNRSENDITLSLEAAATDLVGQPASDITLSTDTLTIPANGTASVTVTVALDRSVPGSQAFGGAVTATGPNNVVLRTGIGYGPPLHRVTIEVLDSHGNRIGTHTAPDWRVRLTNDTFDPEIGGTAVYQLFSSGGVAVGHVPAGTYSVITDVLETDPDTGELLRNSGLVKVEIDIDADTALTLDARDAVPVHVTVARKADKRNHNVTLTRENSASGGGRTVLSLAGAQFPVYVTPAPPGQLAPVRLTVSWTLAEPQLLRPLHWEDDQRCPRLPFTCFSQTPAYVYNLPIVYENGIPGDLHEKITRRDLVEVPSRFHAEHPDSFIIQQFSHFLPSGSPVGDVGDSLIYFRPGKVTEYFLADDRISWFRAAGPARAIVGKEQLLVLHSDDWFPAAEAGARRDEERWFAGPLRVGVWDIREETLDWPDQSVRVATGSRNGPDGEWFAVPSQVTDNSRGHGAGPNLPAGLVSWRMWNADTGAELEPRPGSPVLFPLAPEDATYRLEQAEDHPAPVAPLLRTGPTTTTWVFTSEPSEARVPQRYECRVQQAPRQDVCQIQPLILLEYNLGLDIHNRAPAGRAHRFTITAGHHSKAVDRAPVTDLSVQTSFDDGATWQDARVIGKPKDTGDTGGFLPSAEPYQQFQVVLMIPPLHRTTGFVTLRVQAADANGGTVDQTIHRAYILK